MTDNAMARPPSPGTAATDDGAAFATDTGGETLNPMFISTKSWRPDVASPAKTLRRNIVIGVGVVAVLAAIVVVLVVVLVGGTSSKLQVPQTFSANFRMGSPATDSVPVADVVGALHKTTLADGSWQLTGQATVTAHNQTVAIRVAADGGVYYTVRDTLGEVLKQGCWSSDNSPLLQSVKDALDAATLYDAGEYSGPLPTSCGSAKIWIMKLQGLSLAVCVAQDGSVEVAGMGMSGSMSDVSTTVAAQSPYTPMTNDTTGQSMECTPVYSWSDIVNTASQSRRLGGSWYPYPPNVGGNWGGWGRRLRSVPTTFRSSRFTTCVFVHGAGQYGSGSVSSSFPEYWGSVHNRVNCGIKKFLRMNTWTLGWDSPILRGQFCSAAAQNGVIRNTIVFAHGTGNLIVAAAIATSYCSFDYSTSTWAELQPDYNIGRLTDVARSFCNFASYFSRIQSSLQREEQLCHGAGVSIGWLSAASSTYTPVGVTWNQVSNIIKSQVEAAMCGINPDGLAASQFERISDSFRQRTAGEVQWSTCWDKTYRSRFNLMSVADFYAASVNWFDITCRNGDGMFGGHRQPCTWFWFVTL